MKAGTDEIRQRYNVPDKWSHSQGTIEGARVRIAHSIGPMARLPSSRAAVERAYPRFKRPHERQIEQNALLT
jgi:hypothetical protein